jgi:hypothetical protein
MDVASIKLVRDTMRDGECFWHRMMDAEWEREKTKVDKMVEEGEGQVVARKVHSDKNSKHKSAKHEPLPDPKSTRSKVKGAVPHRQRNEDSHEESTGEQERRKEKKKYSGEKATSSRISKRGRPEQDDEENTRPHKKSSSTRKTTSSSSSRHHSSKTDDHSDKFKAMQRKLRQLAKSKSMSTKLPPTVRGDHSGPL